jgi:hypothetical protein
MWANKYAHTDIMSDIGNIIEQYETKQQQQNCKFSE